MSEYKYTAICHTTCYWLNTLWQIGEVYQGDTPPNKHFSESGVKDPALPPPNPGSDGRSTKELREILENYGAKVPSQWSRKKVWSKLQELENAAVRDSQTAEDEPAYPCPCGFMAKTSTGASAHSRQCSRCKEIMRENDGDSS